MYKSMLLTVCGVFFLMQVAQAGVAVVGNPSRTETLTQDDVKDLFLGNKDKLGSGPVKLVDQGTSSDVRNNFYSKVLGMSPAQMKSHWSEMLFTGKGKPPAAVGSDADVLGAVAKDPAAIGYVDSGKVNSSVKVLFKAD